MLRRAACLGVIAEDLVERRCTLCGVELFHRFGDKIENAGKTDLLVEKGRDRHFVCGVEHGRKRAARLDCALGKVLEDEGLGVGFRKGQFCELCKIELFYDRLRAHRVRDGILHAKPHIRL